MVSQLQGPPSSMTCLECKGRMERGTAPFSIDRKGYHVHWDAVPAWVCMQCGEAYFDRREVERLQKALEVLDRESTTVAAASD